MCVLEQVSELEIASDINVLYVGKKSSYNPMDTQDADLSKQKEACLKLSSKLQAFYRLKCHCMG